MKTLWIGGGLLLLAFALLLAGLYIGQRRLVYFADATRTDAAIAPTFQLQRPDGAVLRGWVDRPGQPRALIYFGGNAETLQGTRSLLGDCCAGWSAYLLPYRGYGGSDGTPSSEAILADALALHDEVAKRHPGQPVALIGRSLGSGVAAHVAHQRDIDRLVLVTPYDRMRTVASLHYPWLPVGWLLRENYDSVDWLKDARTPILIVRAGNDRVVPAASTDALLHALPAATTREIIIPDANHDSISTRSEYLEALSTFLR